MDQKGHTIDQKGQKIEFLDLKYLLLRRIFFAELGGPPSPPNQKIILPKNPERNWGYPPPSAEKIC